MKYKVAMILPYFGKLPNYFPLWLKSAGYNPDFTFMLFTDDDCSCYDIPDNVKIFPMTFDGVKKLVAPHLDFKFVLHTPYKLCDYKPMYGLIFQDWLKGYDFWGYVDPDIIWGDIGKYITDEMFRTCNRIGDRGPIALYRNDEKTNTLFTKKLPGWLVTYRDVYTSKAVMFFDESKLLVRIFGDFTLDSTKKQCKMPDQADVVRHIKQFRLWSSPNPIAAFRWKNGQVLGIYPDGHEQEFLHVHLQKRQMKFEPGLENEDSFLIFPTEFTHDHEITREEITESITPSPEYEAEWEKKYRIRKCINKLMRRAGIFMKDTLRGKISLVKYLIDTYRHNGWMS